MYKETFDFYDSTSIKIYNLDKKIRYELSILDRLDPMTKQHSENVGNLTGRICQYLRLNKQFTVHAIICGYLHDIGKSQIPYEILSKDGSLTEEEFEIMKTHTTLGYKMCMKDLRLRPYAEGPLYHHEALNGTGYPQGLMKEDIPFVARIIRVADEYDALVTKRHYTTHVHISETLKLMMKMQNASNQKKRDYYKEGMIMLFQAGENFQNYHQILKEYRNALFVREQRIDDLYNEIKIIKKLKV